MPPTKPIDPPDEHEDTAEVIEPRPPEYVHADPRMDMSSDGGPGEPQYDQRIEAFD